MNKCLSMISTVTGLRGDATGLSGDITEADLSEFDRHSGVDITNLVMDPNITKGPDDFLLILW